MGAASCRGAEPIHLARSCLALPSSSSLRNKRSLQTEIDTDKKKIFFFFFIKLRTNMAPTKNYDTSPYYLHE